MRGRGGDPLFRRIFVLSRGFLKKKFKSVSINEEITPENQLPDSLENKQSGGLVTGDFHSCVAWVPWFPRPHPAGLLVSTQQAFERGVSVPGMLGHLCLAFPCTWPVGHKSLGPLPALAVFPSFPEMQPQSPEHRGTARLALRAHLVTRNTYLSIFISLLA